MSDTRHCENPRWGIDSVIVQPGASIAGTNHVGGDRHAADAAVAAPCDRIDDLPCKLRPGGLTVLRHEDPRHRKRRPPG